MATFTIDLLTGNIYLFSGDFSGSGGTPTSGSTYPQVANFTSLPTPASSSGQIYLVRSGSGTTVLNRKPAGLYYSTGTVWRYLGDTPDAFKSNNFQIIDSVDNTKGVMFGTSGITTNVFRKLTVQNSDGTIAYLTDLNTKVDITAFGDYTGTTAPATFLSKTQFNTYTGTTLPLSYYNKTQINAYTGNTLLLINAKQDILIAGSGISISGNVISFTGNTGDVSNSTLQLLDAVGGIQVNNITSTPIIWNTQVFSGTSLSFTGGSRIYVKATGIYEISYVLNVNNDTGSVKNIGTLIRKNGDTNITPMSSASVSINTLNDMSTNIMPDYHVTLTNGDYVELIAFRIGSAGAVYTTQNTTWIKIKKI
jgi:hypothetical protein